MKNKTNRIEGKITVTSLGSGYVSSDVVEEDIYVPSQFLNTALNGDEVEVVVAPRVEGEKPNGEVTRVIARKKTEFVGTIERRKDDRFAFMVADDHKIHVPLFLPNVDPEVKNGIKVLARMIKWEDPRKNPTGKVIKVIGKKGDNDVEMESIVLEKGFEVGFPENVDKESMRIKERYEDIFRKEVPKRRDVRGTFTFTIDPVDAKDFDDAISFKKLSNDLFEIGVHIADVASWVGERSALDKEARKRGFSVYLVDRTIPMLPEVLSNDICSLNPNEDKLTFSAIFKMTRDGEVKDLWFGRTVINSDRRFTYQEAQDVIDGKMESPYTEELQTLMSMTRKIRKRRVEAGSLEFGYDEVKVEIDAKGRPTRIYTKEGLECQQLIEELMVLTNKEAALFIGGEKSKRLCIYRIHEKPDKDSLEELFTFLKKLGHEIKFSGNTVSSKDLNALLKKIEGTDEEFMVKSVIIRSMPKAVYSIVNRGHFAMALQYYTHFTSPIRRYADLLVHRSLQQKLEGKTPTAEEKSFYKETAEKISQREVDLASAERMSLALKQTEYMMERIGEVRNGIISGVTEWGIYIQDVETRAEGMIRLKSMKDDFYVLDKENFSISGSRTKKKYSLGDKVKVKITGGDLDRKSLDYVFA